MLPLPHHYSVQATGRAVGEVTLSAEGVPALQTAEPVQFDGPGGCWSPETLLVGAVVDCFVLTFRAIARASKFSWTDLRCEAMGTLDRSDGRTRFRQVDIHARLVVPAETDFEKAGRLLEKAKTTCFITNSLACSVTLACEIQSAASNDIVS